MNKVFLFLLCFGLFLFQADGFSAEKSPKSDVIVTVNGKKITNKDVAERLQEHKNTNEVTPEALKLDIVDRLIMDTLLDEFIDKQGLLVTQGEIDREIEKIRFDIEGRQKKAVQPLEQILALIGFGVTEFKTSIKHSIALEKYFAHKLND
ncbi:MAG: SurA N-terminal domain-containing protein, partial [Planctomycetota bacterium]